MQVLARTLVLASLSLYMVLLASCSPIHPVEKIGLIAPFEGLYRETGYAALDSVRTAIEECTDEEYAVIPLAQDDSGNRDVALRTARKLLEDPALAAVVGPYGFETLAAASPDLSRLNDNWISPIAIDGAGSLATPHDYQAWLIDQVLLVADLAFAQGASRVVVAGVPPEWLSTIETNDSNLTAMRFGTNDNGTLEIGSVEATDAILWLGQPHQGAILASRIHESQPTSAFWLLFQGGNELFRAHYIGDGPIYWVSWVDPQYNLELRPNDPDIAIAHLTYLAACQLLALRSQTQVSDMLPLQLRVIRYENGSSQRIDAGDSQ